MKKNMFYLRCLPLTNKNELNVWGILFIHNNGKQFIALITILVHLYVMLQTFASLWYGDIALAYTE